MTEHLLDLVATCPLGLEELLAEELRQLGVSAVEPTRAAVRFRGSWEDVWRCNWRLLTANRVLVLLGTWNGHDGDAVAAGARNLVRRRQKKWAGLDAGALFNPRRSFAVKATASASKILDVRWIGLKVKDGIVDGQRDRFGQRSSIDRTTPDFQLRAWLHKDQLSLLLDTSGEPLDRRGYRQVSADAPVREHLAAAAILASGWDGQGPVVDFMCGSGTLLAEAGAMALGLPPRRLRSTWAFEGLPGFRPEAFQRIREETLPRSAGEVRLFGVDHDPAAVAAALANLRAAGLEEHSQIELGDAYRFEPPPGPGLVAVNPAYGERLLEDADQWPRLGDLLKQRYAGWTAVVFAGGPDRGKSIGLRPSRRLPVRNGPLDIRLLVFKLY
jgi:putative N6-adenine-specific DNA methylase